MLEYFAQPKVAVVIPAYNAEQFLERAVNSVFATGYQNVEVIIVDDGSRDSTLVVAEHACEKFRGRCRLLQHRMGRNQGVSASRNLGVKSSDSEWIVFLDADDYFLPHRFEALKKYSVNPVNTINAIYELAEVVLEGPDAAGWAVGEPGAVGIPEALTGVNLLERLLEGRLCWQVSTVTIRRDLLVTTGLFNPQKKIAEDCDLWYRIAAAGHVVAGDLDRPVSVYWRHANNTYRYELGHRIAVLKAMLDSWRWARGAPVASDRLALFQGAVDSYATRSIVVAREDNQPRIAARMLAQMAVAGHFSYLLGYEGLRQSWAIAREIVHGKFSAPARSDD